MNDELGIPHLVRVRQTWVLVFVKTITTTQWRIRYANEDKWFDVTQHGTREGKGEPIKLIGPLGWHEPSRLPPDELAHALKEPLMQPWVESDYTQKPQATAGEKDDGGKEPWHLVPLPALIQMVRVLDYGAKKHQPDNWKHVPGWRWHYYNATLRHTFAWCIGERYDKESGLPHLAHAMCCICFLLAQEEANAPPEGVPTTK